MKVCLWIGAFLLVTGCATSGGSGTEEPEVYSVIEPLEGNYNIGRNSEFQSEIPKPFLVRTRAEAQSFLSVVPSEYHSFFDVDWTKKMVFVIPDDANRALGDITQVEVFKIPKVESLQFLIYTFPSERIEARSIDLGHFTAFVLEKSTLDFIYEFSDRSKK